MTSDLVFIYLFYFFIYLGDLLAKMSAGIFAPPRPANEAANIHPRRPRLQKRRGCTRDVRHNRWKDRGYRVRTGTKCS